ncbi:purple acid phosphatase family protein [Thalassobellus sediminis]|uniref:purple acid phosphatase family protein n=1 Tax=Thalassobellus sediminis TaxID=3367753 RepID=UPI003792E4DB
MQSSTKNFLQLITILTCLFLVFNCKSSYNKTNTVQLVRQPYLQNAFKDSISILWITNKGEHAKVKYGTSKAMNKTADGYILKDSFKTRNTVTINGLERGKKYYYSIYTDEKLLASGEEYFFKTEPAERNTSFSFYAMGDIGEPVSKGGFPEITSWQIHNLKDRPNFGLGLGDIIYPDGESFFADAYLFKPMEPILKNIPFYPALGNHDWHVNPDTNFTTEWKLPNNEHYYSFDYGNAHFIALDTRSGEMYDQKNQLKWFENDLKNAQNKYDWIFVYFHHNGISCTYKPEYKAVVDMYPLFTKYNVDLVLNGHAHTYERLMPFDKNGNVIEKYNKPLNEYANIKNGFIQITTGAGGKLKKDWNPGQCDKDIVAASAHRGHFTLINIDGRQLKLKTIASMGGAVLDSLVINK